MAKRQGGKSKGAPRAHKPKALKRSDNKMVRWKTSDDISMDEEDEFHASRDRVLLNGDGEDNDAFGDEEEVFALKGMPSDRDDEEQEGHYDDDGDDDLPPIPAQDSTKKTEKAKRKKGKGKEKADSGKEESEEEDEGWGRGKAAYYATNDDQLASDDEEGHELEEKEAIRLQAKALSGLKDEDFGLNDSIKVTVPEVEDAFAEPLAVPEVQLPTDKTEIIRHLAKTNPECLALARDWADAALDLVKTQAKLKKIEAEDPDALSLGMLHIHYQTLLSYCTMVAFYLHLRTTPKYTKRPQLLRQQPVLKRLLTLKQSLSTLEDLDFAASDDEDFDDEDMGLHSLSSNDSVWSIARQQGLEPDELAELLQDASTHQSAPSLSQSKRSSGLAPISLPPPVKPPKKKRKTAEEKSSKITIPIFDLEEPEFVSSKRPSSSKSAVEDSYGEVSTLHEIDAADKSASKKSLRFHTSKIESVSARRQGARNQAAGGDDDIPYRDRKKEKGAASIKAAAKRASEGGQDLDDEEPEPKIGEKRGRGSDDEGSSGESGDEYYELVKKESKEKKEKKKAEYEEINGRTRVPLEEDSDGPRSLTRAILKNKGLTPTRPKAVRNPRVKKRQKYEKAKKKISSQKAVYKGGLSSTGGRYDGEQSGITKVVKSVRLS